MPTDSIDKSTLLVSEHAVPATKAEKKTTNSGNPATGAFLLDDGDMIQGDT